MHVLDLDQNKVLHGWNLMHKPQIPNLTIEQVSEARFMERIQELYGTFAGFVLIDVAGALDTTALYAATVANLAITPAGLDVMEITEAFKLYSEITKLAAKVGKPSTIGLSSTACRRYSPQPTSGPFSTTIFRARA